MQTSGTEGVQAEAEELRGKLEDARAQVNSNEQMIRWLNNQVLPPAYPLSLPRSRCRGDILPVTALNMHLSPSCTASHGCCCVQVNEVQLHGVANGKYASFVPAALPAPPVPLTIPALHSSAACLKLPPRWVEITLTYAMSMLQSCTFSVKIDCGKRC